MPHRTLTPRAVLFTTLLSIISWHAAGQTLHTDRVRGLRIVGSLGAGFPVALRDSRPVTFSLDIVAPLPPDIRARVVHCDRNWKPTATSFINDELQNITKVPIGFALAPNSVRQYSHTYTLSVPGFPGIERFAYSGNYLIQWWEQGTQELLAEGRFFVAEELSDSAVTVHNRLLPSEVSPANQVNKVEVHFEEPQFDGAAYDRVSAQFVRTVDVYRNRELSAPYRVDVDDRSPNTFVRDWGTSSLTFVVDNIVPGNEYRRLDLRNPDHYPPNAVSRARQGADVIRWYQQGPPDRNGLSSVTSGDQYADYLDFRFELLADEAWPRPVYVVGDFNDWTPSDAWRMTHDRDRYLLIASIRRGVYDYQYTHGTGSPVMLEGNDWRTVNLYTALVYYQDVRFGGFDRILVVGQGRGPGGMQATSR